MKTQASGVAGVVLAAGQGKRMRSALPKVVHPALGKPLLHWSLDALRLAGFVRAVVVVSPSQSAVHACVDAYQRRHRGYAVTQAFQQQALGTGDAARAGFETLTCDGSAPIEQTLLIVTGDTPLLKPETLRRFVNFHKSGNYAASLIGFVSANPFGYGRVLLGPGGEFLAIREEKDCSSAERLINLCNSGIMCVESRLMGDFLGRLEPNNAAGEYYLTDVPGLALGLNASGGEESGVGVFVSDQAGEFEGVNTQAQLAAAAGALQRRILAHWMEAGVIFEAPETAYVEDGVQFGDGVVVEPFVCLRGDQRIGSGTRVKSGTGISLGMER